MGKRALEYGDLERWTYSAVQVVDALRTQGQPVWYMNALNEGHGYRKKENRDVYRQASIMFLKEYLVGEGQ